MPSLPDDTLFRAVVIALAAFLLAAAFVSFSIKIVPENKRIVVFRLGRSLGSRGPGIVMIIPMIDLALWVDLQKTYHYQYRNLCTLDDRKISVRVALEGQVTDPEKSVLNVPNLENALSKLIETEIVEIAKGKRRDELLARDGGLEAQLKDVVCRASQSWGLNIIKLTVDATRQA